MPNIFLIGIQQRKYMSPHILIPKYPKWSIKCILTRDSIVGKKKTRDSIILFKQKQVKSKHLYKHYDESQIRPLASVVINNYCSFMCGPSFICFFCLSYGLAMVHHRKICVYEYVTRRNLFHTYLGIFCTP